MIDLQRSIDRYIGGALCLGYSFLPNPKNLRREDVKEILVVRLWTLGETLLTFPMIEKLREEFPKAKITVLARNRNKDIFKYVDFVDDILLFERENLGNLRKMRGHFDLAIDTEPYLRVSGLLARFLGKHNIGFDHGVRGRLYSEKVRYDASQHCAEIFCDLLKPLGIDYKPKKLCKLKVSAKVPNFGERVVGMHVSTAESAQYRAWPQPNFAKLIDMIHEDDSNAVVVLTGAPGEHKINESVIKLCKDRSRVKNLAGVLSFAEFIALFDHLDLYISNDTGPMHLAAAQGCKTIGLFGPNLPRRFGPFPVDGEQNIGIYHGDKLRCSPCIKVHEGSFKKCRRMKNGTGECMTLISPEEVFEVLST